MKTEVNIDDIDVEIEYEIVNVEDYQGKIRKYPIWGIEEVEEVVGRKLTVIDIEDINAVLLDEYFEAREGME